MNTIKGWKTFVFAVALAGTSVLSSADFKTLIMDNFEITGAAVALAVGVLRLVTTSPIFKSGE